jgi:hypothetical protein
MEYKSRMRIYLDSCSLQRPLDDQTQPRIRVETEAVLVILAAAQAGDIIMVNSEALKAMPSVQWMPSISPLHQQQSCLALCAEQSAASRLPAKKLAVLPPVAAYPPPR